MAARRNSPKVPLLLAVLVAACGCASARASPEPLPLGGFGGFGGFLGSGPGDTSEAPSTTPRSGGGGLVGSVVGAIGGLGRRPAQQQKNGQVGEVTETAHHHPHRHTTTTTAAPAPSTRAPSTAAVSTATSTTSTTASPSSSPATTAAAAKNQQEVQTGERSDASGAVSSTTTPRPTTFTPQQEICRKNWQDVGNETINNSIDVLSILLDFGGIPGQVGAHNWTRNTTDPRDPTKQDPDRWTYFYGNTDYQTFIRVERGSIHSKHLPAERAVPEEVRGDFWWAPKDFCGKLRHAKYYMWAHHCANQTAIETCKVLPILDDRDFYTIVVTKEPGNPDLIHLCAGEACDYSDDNRIPLGLATALVVGR